MNKVKKVIIVLLLVIGAIAVCTSKVGKVVNSNYVEFKDGTGVYSDNGEYTGNYKVFWFIDILDIFNSEV